MTRAAKEAARGKLGAWNGGEERLGDRVRDFPSIQTSPHFPFHATRLLPSCNRARRDDVIIAIRHHPRKPRKTREMCTAS